MLWVERDGMAQMGFGLIKASQRSENRAEVRMCFRKFRVLF